MSFIFSQEIQVRDFIKKGQVRGLEVDFDLPFPDGRPPLRVRKKSPFKEGKTKQGQVLTREKAIKQSIQWGEVLRQKLWGQGVRPKSRLELRVEAALPKPEPIPTLNIFAPRWVKTALVANQVCDDTVYVFETMLRIHLLPRFGERRLDSFWVEDVQRLKAELKFLENGKLRTALHLNSVLALFVRILRDAAHWKVISVPVPPVDYLPVPKRVIEIYEEEQCQKLVVAAKGVSWQAHLCVLLAADAGLRVGEIMGLRWCDVHWTKSQLIIEQQDTGNKVKKPKSKKARPVPMSPALQEALKSYRHFSERVIVDGEGMKIPRHKLRKILLKCEEAAGLPPKSIHKLRHTFATRFLRKGGDIENCRALLGHSNLATTQIYLHPSLKEAAKVIGTL